MLMDNLPYGDFEMQFYDGTLLKNSIDKRELTIQLSEGKEKVHVIKTDSGEKLCIKSSLLPIFRHLQESLKICLDLETSAQASIAKGKKIRFPITIRHPQAKESMQLSLTGPSPSILPSSSLLSTLSTVCPSLQRPIARQLHMVSELSMVHSDTMSYLKDLPIAARPHTASNDMSGATMSTYISNPTMTLDVRKTCFLNDIGWCIQADNHDVLVLLMDGTQFIMDHRRRSLHWIHHGDIRRYALDDNLPETLKSKLVYLPDFMKLLGMVF
jgi:hypothetical protein